MIKPAFDRFYRYAELTELLNALATEYPDLCAITSIGRSHEGREIWLATLTNARTGPAADKPAFWVDANIHANSYCDFNSYKKTTNLHSDFFPDQDAGPYPDFHPHFHTDHDTAR